jgi:hypothetical protein
MTFINKFGNVFCKIKLQINIPTSELWLFENKTALASIDKGITEADNRQLINKDSFAKYINE